MFHVHTIFIAKMSINKEKDENCMFLPFCLSDLKYLVIKLIIFLIAKFNFFFCFPVLMCIYDRKLKFIKIPKIGIRK